MDITILWFILFFAVWFLHTFYMCKYLKEKNENFHWSEVIWNKGFDIKYGRLLFRMEDKESKSKKLARMFFIFGILLIVSAVFVNKTR